MKAEKLFKLISHIYQDVNYIRVITKLDDMGVKAGAILVECKNYTTEIGLPDGIEWPSTAQEYPLPLLPLPEWVQLGAFVLCRIGDLGWASAPLISVSQDKVEQPQRPFRVVGYNATHIAPQDLLFFDKTMEHPEQITESSMYLYDWSTLKKVGE